MNKLFIILAFFSLWSFSCHADWDKWRREILSGSHQERIRKLAVHVDTNAVVRKTPEAFAAFLDHLEKYPASGQDKDFRAYLRYFRSVAPTLFQKDCYKRIMTYGAVLGRYQLQGDKRFEAICLHYIGQENFLLGNYAGAFENTLQSQRIFRELGFENIPDIGKYLHDLALNYYYFRDYKKVKELMEESLKYPSYNQNLDIQRYNTLALAYEHLQQPDSAEFHFRKTIQKSENYRDSTWIALASGNLGSVFAGQKDYRQALPLMMIDYKYQRSNKHNLEMARNAALNIAEVWLHLKAVDSARYYLKEVDRIQLKRKREHLFGEQQRDEGFHKYYYSVRHQYYLQTGDIGRAYRYLDSLSAITHELDGRYNSMISELAERRLENERHLSEMALEKQRSQTASLRWLLVCSAVFLVAVILGLLYYLNRVKAARQQAISHANQQALIARQERIQADAKHARDNMKKQLHAMEEKDALVETLSTELNELRNLQQITPEQLETSLSALANARLLTQQDWVAFRRSFNILFDGALDKIKEKHPDITQSDERIYALTQLEVGTSKMADMLGISPESVRKSRYRLKKRLTNG